MQTEDLIQTLIEQSRQITNAAEALRQHNISVLTWRERPDAWNILECLEHLNRYGNYYLPEIDNAIRNAPKKTDRTFKSGILGGYFAKSMLPKERLNKMKTFRDKNPLNAHLDKTAIDKFIDQQITLIDLLNRSRNVSLNKVKIKTSISGLLRLKLGDTFQVVINHNIRHMKQIERIINVCRC